MNTRKNILTGVMLLMLSAACLLCSGCFIMGGDHFLWF